MHSLFPPEFSYDDRRLQVESISVDALAERAGTPFYCYSKTRLLNNVRRCKATFGSRNIQIHYAMKACSNLSILRLLAAEGLGVDLVSGGELTRALSAGFPASRMIFSGVGKTAEEIRQAMAAGIGQFNVESAEELQLLVELAESGQQPVSVALRVNPSVEVDTHRHITTGSRGNKFGIAFEQVPELARCCVESHWLDFRGLAMHIGSQISDERPYIEAISRLMTLVSRLEAEGIRVSQLDLGGGFGIDYGDGRSLSFEAVAGAIADATGGFSGSVVVEPGRSLVADTGILVSRISYVKEAVPRPFLILDTAMNDLMRPALYQAVHPLIPAKQPSEENRRRYDVVGPVCESTDTFARDYPLDSDLQAGDLLVFLGAGAYGAVMSSGYNSRDIIPEVLVDGNEARLIRERTDQLVLLERERHCRRLC